MKFNSQLIYILKDKNYKKKQKNLESKGLISTKKNFDQFYNNK